MALEGPCQGSRGLSKASLYGESSDRLALAMLLAHWGNPIGNPGILASLGTQWEFRGFFRAILGDFRQRTFAKASLYGEYAHRLALARLLEAWQGSSAHPSSYFSPTVLPSLLLQPL